MVHYEIIKAWYMRNNQSAIIYGYGRVFAPCQRVVRAQWSRDNPRNDKLRRLQTYRSEDAFLPVFVSDQAMRIGQEGYYLRRLQRNDSLFQAFRHYQQ